MMRIGFGLAFAVALMLPVGCKSGDGIVVVTLTSAVQVDGIAEVRGTFTANGQPGAFDVKLDQPVSVPPEKTFGLAVSGNHKGPFTLQVDALDAGGNRVGGGTIEGKVSAGERTDVRIDLTANLAGDGDGGAPVECDAGQHACNGGCVSNQDVATCGSSCTPCPVGANAASATCDGASCGLTCNSGFHLCGGACVSNTDPASCGGSCTPCTPPTGGSSTCDGTQCGGQCPSGQKLCAGSCIPMATSCNGTCDAGKHDCNGLCADNTSVNSCGTSSCTPCSAPANGAAICTNGTCDFTCQPSYKRCGNACIPTGNCCADADCSAPANGSPLCSGGSCTFTCTSGYKACGSSCIATSACCTSSDCSAPNANAVCNAGTCAIGSCVTGWGNCDGKYSTGCEQTLNTYKNCGTCGFSCQNTNNGSAICSNYQCVAASCQGWGAYCNSSACCSGLTCTVTGQNSQCY